MSFGPCTPPRSHGIPKEPILLREEQDAAFGIFARLSCCTVVAIGRNGRQISVLRPVQRGHEDMPDPYVQLRYSNHNNEHDRIFEAGGHPDSF